jgi:hypothetical protein
MTAQTATLTDFLLARIAEDEAEAQARREHSEGCWPNMDNCQSHYGDDGKWSWGPARVLAECEAKRRIVELMSDEVEYVVYSDDVLRALAQPYADHPDWREEWQA